MIGAGVPVDVKGGGGGGMGGGGMDVLVGGAGRDLMSGGLEADLFLFDDQQFAGSFSLLSIDKSENIHLGYALLKPFHGKGLATELVKASFEYVFRTIAGDTVHALTVAENIGSQKVLAKCGFQFTGTMIHEEDEVMVYELKKA